MRATQLGGACSPSRPGQFIRQHGKPGASLVRDSATYIRVSHILGTAHKPRDGHLDLLQEVPLLVLEDGNVEHHDSLDAVIARQYFIIE